MAGTRFASTSKRLGLLIRARFGSIVAVKGFAFALAPPAGRGTEDPHEEGEWGDAPEDEGQHASDDGVLGHGDEDGDIEPGNRNQVHAPIVAPLRCRIGIAMQHKSARDGRRPSPPARGDVNVGFSG